MNYLELQNKAELDAYNMSQFDENKYELKLDDKKFDKEYPLGKDGKRTLYKEKTQPDVKVLGSLNAQNYRNNLMKGV